MQCKSEQQIFKPRWVQWQGDNSSAPRGDDIPSPANIRNQFQKEINFWLSVSRRKQKNSVPGRCQKEIYIHKDVQSLLTHHQIHPIPTCYNMGNSICFLGTDLSLTFWTTKISATSLQKLEAYRFLQIVTDFCRSPPQFMPNSPSRNRTQVPTTVSVFNGFKDVVQSVLNQVLIFFWDWIQTPPPVWIQILPRGKSYSNWVPSPDARKILDSNTRPCSNPDLRRHIDFRPTLSWLL